MPELALGPLLRHAGDDDATVWVQTSGPCTVVVRADGAAEASEPTFCVEGHHYALVHVTGLPTNAAIPYEVLLDGAVVWPEADSPFPPSVLRTHSVDSAVSIVFGSCRVAAPHHPPYTLRKDEDPRGREVDALRGLAREMRGLAPDEWPHALLLLGDQVYADEVHPDVQAQIEGEEVGSFDDYVKLYQAAWGEPVIRWLLSTVPSAMIFDDHDVHDDWNTSIEWVREMRRKEGWNRRIVAAFSSYLIYQHLGNLSPSERQAFALYADLRGSEDATEELRAFAYRADREIDGVRWSFCRDIGPARVVIVDSRAGRVLDPGARSMVDGEEWEWIEAHARGDVSHLLIGTSLPLLMGPAMHHLEAWNEAVNDGRWGSLAKRGAEWLRTTLDLEHWAAFNASFVRLCGLIRDVGAGRAGEPPSTITVLSGDVHHAYLAQMGFPRGSGVRSAVWQAVCSPFRNPLDRAEQRVILAGWTHVGERAMRGLARAAGVPDPEYGWKLAHERPWFDNQVARLVLDGRRATFVLERALRDEAAEHGVRLERVFDRSLEPNPVYASP